jgi:hypothetical protein
VSAKAFSKMAFDFEKAMKCLHGFIQDVKILKRTFGKLE